MGVRSQLTVSIRTLRVCDARDGRKPTLREFIHGDLRVRRLIPSVHQARVVKSTHPAVRHSQAGPGTGAQAVFNPRTLRVDLHPM